MALPVPEVAAPRKTRRPRRLYSAVRTIHTYLGLLNFTNFMVYGIAGLIVTLAPHDEKPRAAEVRFLSFTPPAAASDKAVADSVYALLRIPLTGPVPEWALQHDDQQHLLLNFYSLNGMTAVTVLPDQQRLRIEPHPSSLGRFLDGLHTVTPNEGTTRDARLGLWAYYNAFAMWSLLAMALSGLYLWLSTRPRLTLALVASLTGALAFLLLYTLIG